jgi:hypothetical protein
MRKAFLLLFVASTLLATNLQKIKEYRLKKDETKKILVKYGSLQKIFQFRWTLYKNDGLVVLSSYDRIVAQHMLYLNHINQSFRVKLKSGGVYEHTAPYFIVKFEEFDFEKRKARFSIWLQDKNREIFIKYLDKKEG